jgi:hypothetical protein
MIVDLANARRSYLMSQVAGENYRFFLHSPRKVLSTENERELIFVRKYCPQILDKKISFKEVTRADIDVLIVTSVSMYFKEFDINLVNLVNRFKKQWVAVDYAWEGGRKPREQKNRQFNRPFSNIALAATSAKPGPYLPYSQPELDMYANASKFITPKQVREKYQLPENKKIIVVTSHGKYEVLKPFMKFLARRDDIHVVWKLKFKQRQFYNKVRKAMSSIKVPYTLIAGPQEKSHTDFLSPLCELSLVATAHINLPPLSFSHAEMIRAGIPTFLFGKNGIEIPKYIRPLMHHFWSPESIKICSQFSFDVVKPEVIVDEFHCARNLVSHLKG